MTETISIIIPTYQHASTIAACLDSVLAQTRAANEIIVVDDGSADSTESILVPYLDRVRVIKQPNQGAPIARNNGFKASMGSLILFCDADVLMAPTMLAELESALTVNSSAAYAYSSFKWGWKLFTSFPFEDGSRLKKMNFIHTSALIRRQAFPLFDPTLKRFQDWDLWLTMLDRGLKGVFVPHVLFQVLEEDRPERMSTWLPSLMIRFPWRFVGWKPKRVKKYEDAKELIFKKHGLIK